MNFIDTHTHLNFKAFGNDLETITKNTLEAGVPTLIVVGTNLETSQKAVEIAEKYPNIYAAVGIHPYHSPQTPPDYREELEILAGSGKTVAVGEIGLDFFKIKNYNEKDIFKTRDKQLEILRGQLGLAVRLGLPAIIHNRRADKDLLNEIRRYEDTKRLRGVFHCFDSTWDFAQRILENDFYLSFSGIVTYPDKDHLIEVIKNTPNDRLLLETDSPYLSPEPIRNERNVPKNVKIIARKIAEVKGTNLEKIARETTNNAQRLFKI